MCFYGDYVVGCVVCCWFVWVGVVVGGYGVKVLCEFWVLVVNGVCLLCLVVGGSGGRVFVLCLGNGGWKRVGVNISSVVYFAKCCGMTVFL